jgi:Collagen triple helix repeat (20 copies)
MAEISKYGIKYGTGELFLKDDPGGTLSPDEVTSKITASSNSTTTVESGYTSENLEDISSAGQDLLDALSLVNIGTGSGIYAYRNGNTFQLKTLDVENGLTIRSTNSKVIIGGNGSSGSGGISDITTANSSSVNLVGEGTESSPLTASVNISATSGNIITVSSDGIFANAVGEKGEKGDKGDTGDQGIQGPVGPQGEPGSDLLLKGAADDVGSLPTTGNTEGDAWIVDAFIYVWTNNAWVNGGEIVGPEGPQGLTGIQGPQGDPGIGVDLKGSLTDTSDLVTIVDMLDGDAYFIQGSFWCYIDGSWQNLGNLTGPTGPAGATGATGPQGDKGDTGATGPAGADGQDGQDGEDGTSVTGATINSQSHLILTTSNPTGTIDAGPVTSSLVTLTDVNISPLSGDNGKAVVWDSTTSKFILGSGSSGSSSFLTLTDAPNSFSGASTKLVAVNTAGTALEFVNKIDTFVELTDVPASYTGQGGKYVAVNSGATGLEFVSAPTGTSGLVSYTFRVNFSNAYVSDLAELPAGWSYVLNGTSPSWQSVSITMDAPKNIISVTSFGYQSNSVSVSTTAANLYNRRDFVSQVWFSAASTGAITDFQPATTFHITALSNTTFGAGSSLHAYVRVLTY